MSCKFFYSPRTHPDITRGRTSTTKDLPESQPLMTSPFPSLKVNGPRPSEESNCLQSLYSRPERVRGMGGATCVHTPWWRYKQILFFEKRRKTLMKLQEWRHGNQRLRMSDSGRDSNGEVVRITLHRGTHARNFRRDDTLQPIRCASLNGVLLLADGKCQGNWTTRFSLSQVHTAGKTACAARNPSLC